MEIEALLVMAGSFGWVVSRPDYLGGHGDD